MMKFLALIIILFLPSCGSYFVHLDYFRFDDDRKMITTNQEEKKCPKKNLFFKNRDIQIVGTVRETSASPLLVTIYFNSFRDSILLSNLQIFLISDSLSMPPIESFVNIGLRDSFHFAYFGELSKQIRMHRFETYYFGFQSIPLKDEISLRLLMEYTILDSLKEEIIVIEGLRRRKGRKFIPLH